MAVISVSITESSEQIISGIPKSLTIATNIPATIFYTFDGTDPDEFSDIYTSTLKLPTDQFILTVKIFATNGTDSSAIITNIYQTDQLNNNVRYPHSGTDAAAQSVPKHNPITFGSLPLQPESNFTGTASAGSNVVEPGTTPYSNAFDADGYETNFTTAEFIGIASPSFPVIISETDAIGQTGPAIGFIPKSTAQNPVPPKENSNIADRLFDPKAMVIYQDFTKENNPDNPAYINRMNFSLQDPEKTSSGNLFYTSGLSSATTTGSFVRSEFNPAKNTITYYYLDSSVNRWIISTTPYTPQKGANNLAGMVFSRERGAGFVFVWRTFGSRYLF